MLKVALIDSNLMLARFLATCEQYGLPPSKGRIAESNDAQTKRELKIKQFQREKLLRASLEQLTVTNRASRPENGSDTGDDTEGLEREYWLLKVELAILKAAENRNQIKQVRVGLSSDRGRTLD